MIEGFCNGHNMIVRFFCGTDNHLRALPVSAPGEVLASGDPIRYGRPLFGPIEDERFPLPVIIPLCLSGDDVDAVTWENFGEEVKLYLYDREGNL